MDERLQRIVSGRDVEVATDPTAFAPERVLVLELLGESGDFAKAAARIGLEWLAERVVALADPEIRFARSRGSATDEDSEGDDAEGEDDRGPVPGRLYVGMPTVGSFRRLKSLWDTFKRDGRLPENHSDWRELFLHLHDVRTWGPKDRISEVTRTILGGRLVQAPSERVNIEVDLWFRNDETSRREAADSLLARLAEAGGMLLDRVQIKAIHYQAALVSLPPSAVLELVGLRGPLALAQEVMSVRPQSMFRSGRSDDLRLEGVGPRSLAIRDTRPALAALIDGYPVENHALLRNRIDVVELDVLASSAPVALRRHATAMASLILHGDLQDDAPAIDRTLKVVPVLRPNASGFEEPPSDKLAIRLVWRAVRDLKKGRGEDGPSGRDVIIVNHSICDEAHPFTGTMSHWARALDHLAYHHGILFIASAGNIREGFPVPAFGTATELVSADPVGRRTELLLAVDAAKAGRSMFAPAEGVNVLTVGAAHTDGSTLPVPANVVDPFGDLVTGNLGSGLGLGFGRAVKPDVLMPGGRQAAIGAQSPLSVRSHDAAVCFGQLVAAPDPFGGSTSKTLRTSGTSNAAALATRAALIVADALDDTFADAQSPWYRRPEAACMIKALVAHSASWGPAGEFLDTLLPPLDGRRHVPRRANIARHLGYGVGEVSRIVEASQHRVTLLGGGRITKGRRHQYGIPLPTELSSRAEFRRVTVTLAWLTPVSHQRTSYRTIALEIVGRDGSSRLWEGIARVPTQPPLGSSGKGTLFHAIYEGSAAVPFPSDAEIVLNVQAYSRLTGETSRLPAPYAIAVTLEVAQTLETDIASSVANRIRQPIGARR